MTPTERGQLGALCDSDILSRDNLIRSLRILARSTATDLKTAKSDILLLEKTLDDKKAAHKLMSLQVSLGLAPKLGLMGVELDLRNAENNLLKANQNYYLSLRRAELLVKGIAITTR
jgi:outer membrane protein TolC